MPVVVVKWRPYDGSGAAERERRAKRVNLVTILRQKLEELVAAVLVDRAGAETHDGRGK